MSDSTTCGVANCAKPATDDGWCLTHYLRYLKFGDPTVSFIHRQQGVEVGSRTVLDRFWVRLVRVPSGCWLWCGQLTNGYGSFKAHGKIHYAHRYSYETLVAPIPEGLFIDHLCMVKRCANPSHLEPVTNAENTRRACAALGVEHLRTARMKTHCKRGHELCEENVYRPPSQPRMRVCRLCIIARRLEAA